MIALTPLTGARWRETHDLRRNDVFVGGIVALLAFGVYLRTLFPGLGGGGDSAKFQYVGSVLGTPHPPGYPLYVLVSFCFAHFPAHSLAWRINMMSAFFAAAAVFLCVVVLIRLGVSRRAAAAVGLALAFDHALWGYAVRAEVYSLTGALVALLLFFAVRWQATRRQRDLYLMVATFALSLGNHLTVTTLCPALLAFVLVIDRRVVRVRTVVVSMLLVIAGLAQYGFILLRTAQNAPYLEARASNPRELFDVMRASRFSDQIFEFSPHELIVARVPQLWHLCVAELNPLGVLLLFIGMGALIIRQRAVGVLLVLGAGGILFLTLNVGATDVEGFLVPAFVFIWIVAGIGLGSVVGLVPAGMKHGGFAVMLVAMALPSLQLARNYRANDHHRRTYEIHYFDALFDHLEPRAAIVSETYAVDQLVRYKLVEQRADRGRTIEVLPKDPDTVRQRASASVSVYAFSEGRRALESDGFRFEAVQLLPPRASTGPPIDMAPLPLFRLARVTSCRDVGNTGWQDITDIARDGRLLVRLDNYRSFDSTFVLYAGRQASSAGSPLLAVSQGPEAPSMAVMAFQGPGSSKLAAALQRDGVSEADVLEAQTTVQRIEEKVNDRGQFSWSALDLGGQPDIAVARASVDLNNPRRATLCGWSGRDFFEADREEHVAFGSAGENSFGAGWHGAERSNDAVDFRWTSAREADVLVPLAKTGPITVRLRATPFEYPGSSRPVVALTINAVKFGPQSMHSGWNVYEWTVPAEVWRQGFNRLTVVTSTLASPARVGLSSDTRLLGVAVSELFLRLLPVDSTTR